MNYHSPIPVVGWSEMSDPKGSTAQPGTSPLEEQPLADLPRPEGSTTEQSMVADTPLRAELYFRGDACRGFGVRQVVTWIESLAASGALSEATLAGEWPRCQTRAEDEHSEVMATYQNFRQWAEQNGVSLAPGFQERTRSFIGMDDVEDVVVFPVVALALYDDQDLVAVFPCTDEDRTYTVERALAAFERGDTNWLARIVSEVPEAIDSLLESDSLTAD